MFTIAAKIFKTFLKVIFVFFFAVVAYLFAALLLSVIPVNNKKVGATNDVHIYLLSNGVHTDLVLPVKNTYKDWSGEVSFTHIHSSDTSFNYLAFGWGDKAFYLETPNWSDLKFKTAFNAAFGLGPSAMHATFFKRMAEGDGCVRINLSAGQYQKLVAYIESSFERDSTGKTQNIVLTANYGSSDAFYEAHGRYNLFKTCNTWTNSGLKAAGLKACVWTPFDKALFWHYK